MRRTHTKFLRTAICALLLLGLSSCRRARPPHEIVVSAAISLRSPLRELARRFSAGSGSVRFNFGSSGFLATQIENGAPVSLFLSADPLWIDRLQRKALVGTRHDRFVEGDLVLVAPTRLRGTAIDRCGTEQQCLRRLTEASVRRIAIGNPRSVPLGARSKEALLHFHLWVALTPKLVFGEHAAQVIDYVRRAEVDAAIVYRTDYEMHRRQLRLVMTIPSRAHHGVRYSAAVIARRGDTQLAARFLAYIESPEARVVWRRHGFRIVPLVGRGR